MQNLNKYQTYLPIFPGFYGTIFEPEEYYELDNINSDRLYKGLEELEFDDVEFDYDEYKQEISKECVNFIERELKDRKFIKSIEYEELYSPREYNFENDSIHVEIEINPEAISEYINNNWENFVDYIKGRYTARDGFIPYHSNLAINWKDETYNFTYFSNDLHKLGSVLEFICRCEDITQYEMRDSIETIIVQAVDFEWECNKIWCEECKDWHDMRDWEKVYNDKLKKDLKLYKELNNAQPSEILPFKKWFKLNYKCNNQ